MSDVEYDNSRKLNVYVTERQLGRWAAALDVYIERCERDNLPIEAENARRNQSAVRQWLIEHAV